MDIFAITGGCGVYAAAAPPSRFSALPLASRAANHRRVRMSGLGLRCELAEQVPTMCPSYMHARLCMVDFLGKLGIARHFNHYIESVLDETYSVWLQNEEELRRETSTCALAFRILRTHGYDVSFEVFDLMDGDQLRSNKLDSYPNNISTALELYQASQLQFSENETSLKKIYHWSRQFLEQKLLNIDIHNDLEKSIMQEVDYNLQYQCFEKLDRLEHRRNIENYNINSDRCLKASFMLQNFDEADILKLAVDDFNFCQSVYQEEFRLFQRWTQEKNLSQVLKDDVNQIAYLYFSAAAYIIPPELSDARMSWAKNCLLVASIDDLFDKFGSTKEQDNFVDLCERWDSNYKHRCISTQVYTLFDALFCTVNEFGRKASLIHGFSVTSHFIEMWVDLVNSFKKEAEWTRNGIVPTMEQYMTNGCVSLGHGPIIIPAMYFVGPKLSLDIIRSQEYQQLFEFVAICGRLSNDIRGLEREAKEQKLNSVSLKTLHGNGMVSEDDAKKELWSICDANRAKLLELVVRRNGSVVPQACKELFWNMCKIYYAFYKKNDAFKSGTGDLAAAVKAVIFEPVRVYDPSFID